MNMEKALNGVYPVVVYENCYFSDSLRAEQSGDRIPVGVRFTAPVQTGPGAHPASYTMGAGSFPGGKTAGAWR